MTLMHEEKQHETDKLFIDLKSYHESIKLQLEINPNKFLDTEIIRTNQGIKTQVYNKAKKLPVHWSSKVPYKYKGKAILASIFDNWFTVCSDIHNYNTAGNLFKPPFQTNLHGRNSITISAINALNKIETTFGDVILKNLTTTQTKTL